jgi:hypothetical protein
MWWRPDTATAHPRQERHQALEVDPTRVEDLDRFLRADAVGSAMSPAVAHRQVDGLEPARPHRRDGRAQKRSSIRTPHVTRQVCPSSTDLVRAGVARTRSARTARSGATIAVLRCGRTSARLRSSRRWAKATCGSTCGEKVVGHRLDRRIHESHGLPVLGRDVGAPSAPARAACCDEATLPRSRRACPPRQWPQRSACLQRAQSGSAAMLRGRREAPRRSRA